MILERTIEGSPLNTEKIDIMLKSYAQDKGITEKDNLSIIKALIDMVSDGHIVVSVGSSDEITYIAFYFDGYLFDYRGVISEDMIRSKSDMGIIKDLKSEFIKTNVFSKLWRHGCSSVEPAIGMIEMAKKVSGYSYG